MKILISRTSDGTIGGAEMSALDQAQVLHSLGHEVIYLSSSPRLRQEANQIGIKSGHLAWIQRGKPPLRYLVFWLIFPFFILRCFQLVKKHQPDIINPHSREDQIAFSLTKRWHGKPVVWKDAGDLRYQLRKKRQNPFGAIYQLLLMRALKNTDHIYMLKHEDISYVKTFFNKPIKTGFSAIPSSIIYKKYNLKAARQSRPKDKIIVGYIGRLDSTKRLDLIIEAARLTDQSAAEYWICGSGSQLDQLQRQAVGLKNIKFIGQVQNVASYLNTFDVFVQPTPNEGWGRNIKEAMYFGLPVIGSASGGAAQQITDGKTGLLFKPEDSADLAVKVSSLIKNSSLRQKLGQAAQAKAMADGDFYRIVEKEILPIYGSYAKKS